MASACRKILRNTLCSIPFVLGVSAGILLYLKYAYDRQDSAYLAPGDHALLHQEASLLGRLETNINLLKDTPANSYVRPRFIRDEINMTDQLLLAIIYNKNSTPKNFLKYHNLTTSRLTKKFVLFEEAGSSKIGNGEPFQVELDNLNTQNVFKYLLEKHANYLYYYIIDSTALINGIELADIIQTLHFKSDFLIGVPKANFKGMCDVRHGLLVHSYVLPALINESVKVECSKEVHGVRYTTVTQDQMNIGGRIPNVITGLASELDYQSAAKRIIRDQLVKIEAKLESLDEEIEVFIDESEYLEADWPEVVYKPKYSLERADNDVYEYIDADARIVDNDLVQTKEGEGKLAPVLADLQKQCNLKNGAKLTNAWRKINYAEGVNYILNFGGSNLEGEKMVDTECLVHQEVSEPLLISLPFVTESTKISLVIPVSEQDRTMTTMFLKNFAKMCLDRNDRIFLMLVFLYTRAHPDKNNNQDYFKEVKQTALQFTKKYKKKDKGSSILWYSLQTKDTVPLQIQAMDLLIQKLDSESIILVGSPYMELHNDYLNRVRMNTIQGRLVFSPIPFTDYNSQVLGSGFTSNINTNQFNASSGHFDSWNFDHISFYKNDYLAIRPNLKSPVIVKESDLLNKSEMKTVPIEMFRIADMFDLYGYLRSQAEDNKEGEEVNAKGVHILRAPEPSLRLKYKTVKCDDNVPLSMRKDCESQQRNSLGSRNLLASIFLKNNLS